MRSELIEFFRFDDQNSGMLRRGDRFLRARGNEPVTEVRIPIAHSDFLRRLDHLRYAVENDAGRRDDALDQLSRVVTEVLGDCAPEAEPVQIDLVTNAAELSALPFELAVDTGGRPVFAASDPPFVLTRRVRTGLHGERHLWWSKPRVLFAAASPAGAGRPVPLEAHRAALRDALKPWSEPLPVAGLADAVRDNRRMLTTIDRASLSRIRTAALAAAAEGRPYTHLHVLAHGCDVGDRFEPAFGVALFDDDDRSMAEVTPDMLREVIQSIEPSPVVVTLAVCDGGNESNSVTGGGSLAHALHVSGVPVVLASQFPLTFAGSHTFARGFYHPLLAGADVREALHATRTQLYREGADTAHDWASLVAYVQLPEDYQDRLYEVAMQAEMASLRTAQLWSDRLVNEGITDAGAYDTVAEQLGSRIASLKGYVEGTVAAPAVAARLENLGILGSAQKRFAELAFHRARLGETDRERWEAAARAELSEARRWYLQGFTRNLSHHWHGVQALSLEAALTGRIERVGQWYAAREAAEADDDAWAPGSLAELLLLAPFAGRTRALDEAEEQLAELVTRTRAQWPADDPFPVDSTIRQFGRYLRWWTAGHGYFPGFGGDLTAEAARLLERLRALSGPSSRAPAFPAGPPERT
ncbi:CHAT domain-containing protein [Actinoplanes sp. LDG1-06]|uniref:CHAT domain-containing protein n=1 Tax=Paractinoplanes ovalisporus TaxID=2810368 RepID=A0ABS2AHI5_9ACTN|nr:CHAT domain-containing protein [Actinoplanes ovalisporus]MBM2618818.1 CHAT domain-containing protein [Actinoplanes ovalisporus]